MIIDRKFKVVFIDLDGTLISTQTGRTFQTCIADMKILWKTWKALKKWVYSRGNDWYIRIVTNQGGISKGLVNEKYWLEKIRYIVAALTEYLGVLPGLEERVSYDYCTSLEQDDPNRKPNPGMLVKFTNSLAEKIDKSEIVMIGDASGKPGQFSDSDLRVAKNFGISYIDVEDLWKEGV